jgi:glycosyltransferase involved in cell wall biosynthesis
MADYAITVLIPTYNHERYILDAIASVARQTLFRECLVIVSDDCSTDSTFDIAKQAAHRVGNIIVQRNAGNLGVMQHYRSLATQLDAPFTAIIEGDDLWLTNTRLETLRNMLLRNRNMAMCFSACIVDHESTGERVHHPPWNVGRNRIIHIMDLIHDNPVATFSNCFYRTADLKQALAGSDSGVGYDWLCNMKIALTADIGFVAAPSTLYRVHPFGQWSKLSEREQNAMKLQSLKTLLLCAPRELRPYICAAIEELE